MKDYQKEINSGLAEVCKMLANYKDVSEPMKKQFLKYSQVFESFSKINKSVKEVKMVENKKQTQQQKDDLVVKEIISQLVALEKKYPSRLVERACSKYKGASVEKRTAMNEINLLEKKLQLAKSKLR